MDWKAILIQNGVVVADGAWGTELAKKGLKPGECPESWNLHRPQDVRALPAAYVQAGAQIVLTNTFGASRLKLARSGLADRTAEINREGARLSREAAQDRALVFASVGPTGELLQPLGSIGESEMIEVFREQIQALLEGGIDGVAVETMSDLAEAKCALKAAREVGDLPVVTCATFDKGPAGYATMMGVTPEHAASELQEAGADIVGSNCGLGIQNMLDIARLMRPATSRPLWIKSNAGKPELVGGRTVFRDSPKDMAARVPELVEAGAQFIGGCCGTTANHIEAIAQAASNLRSKAKSNLEAVRFRP